LKLKRLFHKQLFILISTPFYGNVGDHAIVLSEIRFLRDAHVSYLDISSVEYKLFKKNIVQFIRKDDIILIDGGGNMGDIWPGTMEQINDIVKSFINNKIMVFPESWYFTDNHYGKQLLKDTMLTFNEHKDIILFARDSWSFVEMKKNLTIDVRLSFDCVLLMCIPRAICLKNKGVAISIREDKESNSNVSLIEIQNILKTNNIDFFFIKNDCYKHIPKIKRKSFVHKIISEYLSASLVITDRFHGMIFSIICGKPCIVFDNKTKKIKHFYNDINQMILGIDFTTWQDCTEGSLIDYINSLNTLVTKDDFTLMKELYRDIILNQIESYKMKKGDNHGV